MAGNGDVRPVYDAGDTGNVAAEGVFIVGADGQPVDMTNLGGGGGGGTPLPPELLQAIQDAIDSYNSNTQGFTTSLEEFAEAFNGGFGTPLDPALIQAITTAVNGYTASLAGKQPHSANLDELAAIDPSDLGKQILTAANAAAVRGLIAAQLDGTALSYRIGQRVDFLTTTPANQRVGFLRAAGPSTLYDIATNPQLAAAIAPQISPTFAFAKKYAPETYTSPNGTKTVTRLGTRLLHYAVAGSSSSYAHRSDDNGDNWVRVTTTNLYTAMGSVNPRWSVTFNNAVYLFATAGQFISSADGLTGWTAVQSLATVLGAPVTAIQLYSVRILDDRLWVCGSFTGGTVTSFVAYMNAAGVWTRCNTPLNRVIVDITRKPNDTIAALGNGGGEICTSDDNGATWTTRLFGLNVLEAMNVCCWVPHLNVFAFFGSSGRFVQSTNGKDNYAKGSISGFITAPNDVAVAAGQIVLACSGTGLDGRGRLHVSPDMENWSFRLVAGPTEEVTLVSQVYYSGNRFILLHNGSSGGMGSWLISTSDIPNLPADKFFLPAGSPPAGWDTYVFGAGL